MFIVFICKLCSKKFTYESTDNPINDHCIFYAVNVHNIIIDSVIQSIVLVEWFEKHKHLYADFNCLDPNNFILISHYQKIH